MTMKCGVGILSLALVGWTMGCATRRPLVVDTSAPAPAGSETTLAAGDVFEIRVFGESDLTNTYRIGADGAIDFPLVGHIVLGGMEPHQAARLLEERLAEKYLKHPQVSILLKELVSKKIIVIGQVTKPGTFPYQPNMSVVEAITLAGGFTPIAAKNKTSITRIENGKKIAQEVPVAAIGEGKAVNVMLRPGDIISVPERLF